MFKQNLVCFHELLSNGKLWFNLSISQPGLSALNFAVQFISKRIGLQHVQSTKYRVWHARDDLSVLCCQNSHPMSAFILSLSCIPFLFFIWSRWVGTNNHAVPGTKYQTLTLPVAYRRTFRLPESILCYFTNVHDNSPKYKSALVFSIAKAKLN